MLAVKGSFQNGVIRLDEDVRCNTWAKVVVIFLDHAEPVEVNKPARKQFSFRQARDVLKEYHGSLSDAVLEERREEL